MSNNNERKKLTNILREPLSRQRVMLYTKLNAAQNEEQPQPFTFDEFKKLMESITSERESFRNEVQNVIEAIQTGEAPNEPNLRNPENQFLWGAAISYLTVNPEILAGWKTPVKPEELAKSKLWEQVSNSRDGVDELYRHAQDINEAIRGGKTETKYKWGTPGTGIHFDRAKKAINIDLTQALVTGFEHSRADVNREIGYSLLSRSYPDRMAKLYEELAPLSLKAQKASSKKNKGPKLSKDEYKKLRLLSAEWQLRDMMYQAAEENCVNRYVSNLGDKLLQDYSVSVNNTAVTGRGIGLGLAAEDSQSSTDELKRYINLCEALKLSYYQNNNLFEDKDDSWRGMGVRPELVRQTSTLKKRAAGSPEDDGQGIKHPDFEYLRKLGKKLEDTQPKMHLRMKGLESFFNTIKKANDERNKVVEEIWDKYAEELLQKILQEVKNQVEEQMKQQQDQDGDGDDNDQDQDGEGKPQKGKGGKAKPQKGPKQKGEQGEPGDGDGDGEESDDADGEPQQGKGKGKPKKGDKKDQDKQKGKGDGDDQDKDENGDDQDQDGEGKSKEGELGTDKDKTVPVDGAGDMPDVERPAETPEEARNGNDKDGQDADGKDADGDGDDADGNDGEEADGESQDGEGEDADGETMAEMERRKAEQEAADAEGDEADGQGQKGKGKSKPSKKSSKDAGHGTGRSLGKLSEQDWTQYEQRIKDLIPEINAVRKMFKKIQEFQLQRTLEKSPSLEIMPENGEVMERFNFEAHKDLTIKRASGNIEEADLKRFHIDENKDTPATLDVVLAIDGSGSMQGKAINSAMQAAAILFEAAAGKDMKINVYAVMWGEKPLPEHRVFIRPGDDRIKIGQAMQQVRDGTGSGTDFAPGLELIAETIAKERGESGTMSGFTHILIISDGDIGDADAMRQQVATLFQNTTKVTLDTAIIGRSGTSMEQVSKSMKGSRGAHQELGIVIENDPEKIPMAIAGLVLDKVRKNGSFRASTNSKKRQEMRRAVSKMKNKR